MDAWFFALRQTSRAEMDFLLVFGCPISHAAQISKVIGVFLHFR